MWDAIKEPYPIWARGHQGYKNELNGCQFYTLCQSSGLHFGYNFRLNFLVSGLTWAYCELGCYSTQSCVNTGRKPNFVSFCGTFRGVWQRVLHCPPMPVGEFLNLSSQHRGSFLRTNVLVQAKEVIRIVI